MRTKKRQLDARETVNMIPFGTAAMSMGMGKGGRRV